MNYLLPEEYEAYGLAADTSDAWVTTASALIDGHCRRPSLGVTAYTERLRVTPGSGTVRLSFLPLAAQAPATVALTAARVRYAAPRRGEMLDPLLLTAAWAFALPGSWSTLDVTVLDAVAETGEVTLPVNLFGLPYNEIEIAYTAGLAAIPAGVKAACAQIVKNAQATPALNVRQSHMDTMRVQYFAATLLDETVCAMLAPYVASRLG